MKRKYLLTIIIYNKLDCENQYLQIKKMDTVKNIKQLYLK